MLRRPINNVQRKTRKELRDEKTAKNRRGLITPFAASFFGRLLAALVYEWFKQ